MDVNPYEPPRATSNHSPFAVQGSKGFSFFRVMVMTALTIVAVAVVGVVHYAFFFSRAR